MDVVAEISKLEAPASPNLPLAPNNYIHQHFDILNNVLRLYFNRLAEALKGLFGANGGRYLQNPHIAASDSTDQYATADDTPTMVVWDSLDAGSGFTLNMTGTATAQQGGIYKIDYSMQLVNTDNTPHDAIVWLEVTNGGVVQVPNSTRRFSIPARKSAGVPAYATAYSSVTFEMKTNDEVALWWATEKAYDPVGPVEGVYMEAAPAQTSPYDHPTIPSAIGSITFVSAVAT
jgi:hypothetical protein